MKKKKKRKKQLEEEIEIGDSDNDSDENIINTNSFVGKRRERLRKKSRIEESDPYESYEGKELSKKIRMKKRFDPNTNEYVKRNDGNFTIFDENEKNYYKNFDKNYTSYFNTIKDFGSKAIDYGSKAIEIGERLAKIIGTMATIHRFTGYLRNNLINVRRNRNNFAMAPPGNI